MRWNLKGDVGLGGVYGTENIKKAGGKILPARLFL
jgi:hypothetical protein